MNGKKQTSEARTFSGAPVKSCLPSVRSRSKITASSGGTGKPRSWVFKITNCFESEEDAKRIEQIKAGPKKSHEWSIFKGQSNKVNSGAGKKGDDSSDSDSGGFTT